jgi:hypothetical protein
MFIRFVVPSRHEDSQCLTGVFHAAYRLRDRGRLSEDKCQWCDGILYWFNRYLPIPDRFSRSRRRSGCRKAICWFKDGAARYIGRVRELVTMLDSYGISVEMLRTDKPGYVV